MALTLKVNGEVSDFWQIVSVRLNVLTGEEAVLEQKARHDTTSPHLSLNDLIEIYDGAARVFKGWVRTIEPGGVEREGLVARAIGPKAVLCRERIARVNEQITYTWNQDGRLPTDRPSATLARKWKNGEVFIDLMDHALGDSGYFGDYQSVTNPWLGTDGALIAGWTAGDIASALDTEMGEFAIQGAPFGEALTTLCEYQGQVVWYIEPSSLDLRVKALGDLPIVDVYAGVVGKHISEGTAGDFNLISNPMSFDITGARNFIRIQGRNRTIECRPDGLPGGRPSGGLNTAGVALRPVLGAGPPENPTKYDYRLWQAPLGYRLWRKGQMQDDQGRPYGQGQWMSGELFALDGGALYKVNKDYVIYYDLGLVYFMQPQTGFPGHTLYAWFRCEAPFYVTATCGEPVSGFVSELCMHDEEMEHPTSRLPLVQSQYGYGAGWGFQYLDLEVRDDTAAMQYIANRLLDVFKGEKVNAEVTVRGVDFGRYQIGKAIRIQNLGRWADLALAIVEVEARPAQNVMRLRVSNDVLVSHLWGYRELAARRRREHARLVAGRKLQALSKYVQYLTFEET